MENQTIDIPTNDEMTPEAQESKEKKLYKSVYTDKLAAYIRKGFEGAKVARSSASNGKDSIDTRLIQSQRQVNCVYDPEVLASIEKFGGCKDYDPLTIQKCLVAESWIKDIMSPSDDKPWTIEPSPIPDLPNNAKAEIERKAMEFYQQDIPAEVQESDSPEAEQIIQDAMQEKTAELRDMQLQLEQAEAKERAARQEQRIYDQLSDGEFMAAFDDFVQHLSRSLIGILKGPVYKKKKVLKYEQVEGKWGVNVSTEDQQYYYAPNPQNVYFSPNCRHQDTGDIFEIIPYQTSSIQDMIGLQGYNNAAIRKVLQEHKMGNLREWTNNSWESDSLQDRQNLTSAEYNGQVDAIDYWGKAPGHLLREWGMGSDIVPDVDVFYDVHAILIGRHVILSELNPDKLGRRPYHITSFEKQADNIYGRGIPEKVRPAQRAANMVRRSLINNVAIASGPQVVVNSDALPQGEKITQMHAWKIWQTKFMQGVAQKPIDFFQPNDNSQNLVALLDKFYNDADRDTGIPRYVQGDQNAALKGAAGTASGLSMLMNAASKSMKRVLSNIDTDIFQRVVTYQYDINMRDPEIPDEEKGDFNIRVKGSLALAVKEQLQQSRAEFLQTVLSNETLMGIVQQKGIVALLREITKGLDMPPNVIIPSDQELNNAQQDGVMQQLEQVIVLAVENGVIDEQQAQLLMNPEVVESELDAPVQ